MTARLRGWLEETHRPGFELVRRLIEVGRDEKLSRIVAGMLPDNRAMIGICEKLGFRIEHELGEEMVRAEIDL
jgi:acetyltransferase